MQTDNAINYVVPQFYFNEFWIENVELRKNDIGKEYIADINLDTFKVGIKKNVYLIPMNQLNFAGKRKVYK